MIFRFSKEKPGNITAFVLVVSFLPFGLILVFGTDTQSITKQDELLMVGGFITVALGFVFGRSTS